MNFPSFGIMSLGSSRWVVLGLFIFISSLHVVHLISIIVLLFFLHFNLFWCAIWKIQPVHFVRLILNNSCPNCDMIPYTFELLFSFRFFSLYCTFNLVHIMLFESLISESIYVLSSHVNPQCHQFIVVLWLAWLFLDFGYMLLLWICCSFDLLVPF